MNLQKAFSLRPIKIGRFEIINGVKYVKCIKHAYKFRMREQVGFAAVLWRLRQFVSCICMYESRFKRGEKLAYLWISLSPRSKGRLKLVGGTVKWDNQQTSFFLGIEQTLGVGVPVIVHGHNIGLIQHFFKNFLLYSSATLHPSSFSFICKRRPRHSVL